MALVLGASISAQAAIDIQPGDYIYITDGPGGSGGVFNIQETNNLTHTSFSGDIFPTFCVELSEHITLPNAYYVENLSNVADQTGNTLTVLAGSIYAEFLAGTLPNMPLPAATFATKTTFNNSVQVAIWRQVIPAASLASLVGAVGGDYNPVWYAAINGIALNPLNGVQIMNLRGSSNVHASYNQDLLVRNTPPETNVPEAAAMMTWGLIMISAGFGSRRVRTVA